MESGPQTGPPPPAGEQIGFDVSRDFGQSNHASRSLPSDHEGEMVKFSAMPQPLGGARARSRNVSLWSPVMVGSYSRRAEAKFSVGHVDSAHNALCAWRTCAPTLDAHSNCMSEAGSHLAWLIGCDGGRDGGMQSVYEPAAARR